MDIPRSQRVVVTSLVAAIVFFAFLVRISLNLKDSRRSFRNEMAQRLDLEEKISGMEKERQDMMGKIRILQTRLDAALQETKTMSSALEQERQEMTSLRSSLEKQKDEKNSPTL